MTSERNVDTSRPDGAIDLWNTASYAYPRKQMRSPPMKKLPKEMQEVFAKHREYFVEQGAKGGKKRASRLTAEQRKQIAKRAAAARWRKGAK